MNSAGERRPTPLDVAEIITLAGLAAGESHDTLDSTNDRATQLALHEDCPLPYLVHTFNQTRGRGRGSNQWHSSAGSLTFSVMIRGDYGGLLPESWPRVAIVTGLAIAEVIELQSPAINIQLKWPNDLLIDGKKLAGILVESPPASRSDSRVIVIGVGLNLANRLQEADVSIQSRAISLRDLGVAIPNLSRLVADLCQQILMRVQHAVTNWHETVSLWKNRCALTGQRVVIEQPHARITGLCLGIDHSGGLQIQGDDGNCLVVHSGHVLLNEGNSP